MRAITVVFNFLPTMALLFGIGIGSPLLGILSCVFIAWQEASLCSRVFPAEFQLPVTIIIMCGVWILVKQKESETNKENQDL
jgi:hypothetical protein